MILHPAPNSHTNELRDAADRKLTRVGETFSQSAAPGTPSRRCRMPPYAPSYANGRARWAARPDTSCPTTGSRRGMEMRAVPSVLGLHRSVMMLRALLDN